ncbi:MAG: Flp family type IVb pilin [Sneathiella sp.]|uniref:Flp family type IVb pilin n=1 Tax=Sneathiella sp. TaxID=1964365 RepID=UPI003002B56E
MIANIKATKTQVVSFLKCDSGATMVEYALLVAVIGMVVVVGAIALGDAIGVSFCDMAQDLDPTAVC